MNEGILSAIIDAGGLVAAVVILWAIVNRIMDANESLTGNLTDLTKGSTEAMTRLSESLDNQNGVLSKLCDSMEEHRREVEGKKR